VVPDWAWSPWPVGMGVINAPVVGMGVLIPPASSDGVGVVDRMEGMGPVGFGVKPPVHHTVQQRQNFFAYPHP